MSLFASEAERLERFPVARHQIFLGHAGVTALPQCAAEAMITQVRASCENHQEFGEVLRDIDRTRQTCARLIGADKSEIALLGPTSLGLSLFANGLSWQPGDELRLDLLPGRDAHEWLRVQQKQRPDAELKTVLADALPRRFAQRLCEFWLPNRPMRQFDPPQLREVAAVLADWPLVASGTEGYRTAEVTLGGVDTDGVSSSTMQSRQVPGLYFVGEVLDVTGWLGGYNFQWAWASGHAAGMALAA